MGARAAALICGIGPRLEGWTEANPHAVVVARHGVLVYEHYFTGKDSRWNTPLGIVAFDASKKHDLLSISKSVVSLLTGGQVHLLGTSHGCIVGTDY